MASQYPLNDNDVDDVLDEEDSTEDESLEESEVDASYSGKQEPHEDFSVAARQRLREELARQVEAFLARGGHINEIPSSLNDIKPKKPVSDYGDRMM